MHIQVINYALDGVTEDQYIALCNDLAPQFGKVPGLLGKYWLANAEQNVYGGIYLWENKAAMDAYMKSELASTVAAHPNLRNITSRDFEVISTLTRFTNDMLRVA